MFAIFNKCYELEYLDLSNFDTSNVTDMGWMFNQCNKLKELNISNFTFNIKCNTEYMFNFDSKMKCNFITNNATLKQLYNS